MENKEIRIEVPEGMEIDKENSTFECIKFKPKAITYTDVARALFEDKTHYWPMVGNCEVRKDFHKKECSDKVFNQFIGTSPKQIEKLIALNKLMNVAKYLNGDWKPMFKGSDPVYFHCVRNNGLCVDYWRLSNYGSVCFKTEELARKAIEILGEETIKLALCADY